MALKKREFTPESGTVDTYAIEYALGSGIKLKAQHARHLEIVVLYNFQLQSFKCTHALQNYTHYTTIQFRSHFEYLN